MRADCRPSDGGERPAIDHLAKKAIRWVTLPVFVAFLQTLTGNTAELNRFSEGEIANPADVNENFDTLMRLLQNQQRVGSFYRVNCSSNANALLEAIAEGESLIEVEAGPCLANTGTVGEDVPLIGDLHIKGVGAAKPIIYTTDDEAGLQYLGGKNGSLVIENVRFEGSIISVDSAASFTARDSVIRCQDEKISANARGYQIGIYLNGGSGALLGSSVENCSGPAVLLDSSAHLNATDSNIDVVAGTTDFPSPIGISLRQASSTVLTRTSIGGTGNTFQNEIPIFVEHADITLIETTVRGTAWVNRASTMTVINSDYRWPDSDIINVVLVMNDSAFFGTNTSFERTTITSSLSNEWDPSSKIYLSSDANLTHANLTLSAGKEISLQGDFLGANLNASIGSGGSIRVNATTNQFNPPSLKMNSVLHLTNPASGPSLANTCNEGTATALYWGSDPTTQTGVLCAPN